MFHDYKVKIYFENIIYNNAKTTYILEWTKT